MRGPAASNDVNGDSAFPAMGVGMSMNAGSEPTGSLVGSNQREKSRLQPRQKSSRNPPPQMGKSRPPRDGSSEQQSRKTMAGPSGGGDELKDILSGLKMGEDEANAIATDLEDIINGTSSSEESVKNIQFKERRGGGITLG
jgi:hypothetical protein